MSSAIIAGNTVRLKDIYLPNFADFHKAFKNDYYTFYVLKGGRGSGKSAQIGTDIILEMMKKPVSALVVRKIGNTIGTSVYEQLLWSIEQLKVDHLWSTKGSKTEKLLLTYIPTGNKIYFRGADNPKKIKGLKDSKFPVAIAWLEELDEFRTEEEVTTIVNSVIREELKNGLKYKIIYSYNPPKRKHSWINKKFESVTIPKNYFIHKSDYRTNRFLSKQFLEEAYNVKELKPQKYKWEYLGEPIGSGVVPFDNLIFEEITDQQISTFDNIRQGLDWGYGADPASVVRMHFDKKREKLYIFGQIYGVKISNKELARRIKANGWDNNEIIADSAEPKSIDNLKDEHGVRRIVGAKKGPGSVETGEKWLDELQAIIIDPVRCPDVAREFESIDYETDKNGNVKNRLVDKDNHTIDAVRYATEKDIRRKVAKAVKNVFG